MLLISFLIDFSSIWGIGVFLGVAIIFVLSQYFILSYLKEIKKENKTQIHHVDKMYIIVSIAQYILACITSICYITNPNQSTVQSSNIVCISYNSLWNLDNNFGLVSQRFFIMVYKVKSKCHDTATYFGYGCVCLQWFFIVTNYLNILMQQNQLVCQRM